MGDITITSNQDGPCIYNHMIHVYNITGASSNVKTKIAWVDSNLLWVLG